MGVMGGGAGAGDIDRLAFTDHMNEIRMVPRSWRAYLRWGRTGAVRRREHVRKTGHMVITEAIRYTRYKPYRG